MRGTNLTTPTRALRIVARAILPGLLLHVIAGCAHYTPLPLPSAPGLTTGLQSLQRGAIDPNRPLRIQDIAELAVLNSPDLAAARAQRGVTQAQLQQAGLLPNPVISAAILPLAAGIGDTTAWSGALGIDIRALLTRGSRKREARASLGAIDASLLWQEWQTIAQARLLAVDIEEGDRLLDILSRARTLFAQRAQDARSALARQDTTLSAAAPDFTAYQSARDAQAAQARLQLQRRHQLNALLGLQPDVALDIAPNPDLPAIDDAASNRALESLPARRPDLAALRFGYQAADARLRTAIIAQFPNLSFGISGGSDNANVRNVGPQVSFDLPLFDHNQAAIAGEEATRAQLNTEYAARLASACGQVRAMAADIALLRSQLVILRRDLPDLTRIARTARAARAAGDLDERSAVDLIAAALTKEQDIVTAEQSLLEQVVAVETLTGAGLPPLLIQPGTQAGPSLGAPS